MEPNLPASAMLDVILHGEYVWRQRRSCWQPKSHHTAISSQTSSAWCCWRWSCLVNCHYEMKGAKDNTHGWMDGWMDRCALLFMGVNPYKWSRWLTSTWNFPMSKPQEQGCALNWSAFLNSERQLDEPYYSSPLLKIPSTARDELPSAFLLSCWSPTTTAASRSSGGQGVWSVPWRQRWSVSARQCRGQRRHWDWKMGDC